MRKNTIFISVFFFVILPIFIVGCDSQVSDSEHKHSFESLKYDATSHWYACTHSGCKEIRDKQEHQYGDYSYDFNATTLNDGTKSRKCFCGYIDTTTDEGSMKLYDATYSFTESVKKLTIGTDGTAGTTATYVEFGDFPRTVAKSDIKYNPRPEANSYYIGSDGNYYAKTIVNQGLDELYYSDGSQVKKGEEKYFKVEPIKWRELTDDAKNVLGNPCSLLLSEQILAGMYFCDSVRKGSRRVVNDCALEYNNYFYSKIRAYIDSKKYYYYDETNKGTRISDVYNNKGFLHIAFTDIARKKIEEMKVANDDSTTTDATGALDRAKGCDDAIDKIFLLSEQEVTTADYGFGLYDEYDTTRVKQTTDYAKATGVVSYDDNDNARWWLRSPHSEGECFARYVDEHGVTDPCYWHVESILGVVPALGIVIEK